MADAYEAGLGIAFEGLFADEERRRVSLPTYPFQRRRYWVDAAKRQRRETGHPLLGLGVDELLYGVEWREGSPVGLRDAGFLAGPEAVASGMRSLHEVFESEGVDRAGLAVLGEELERESRWYALSAFGELGWEREAGERFEGEELRRRLKVTGEHRRLFGRLLGLLDEAGVVGRETADGWVVTVGSEDGLPEGGGGAGGGCGFDRAGIAAALRGVAVGGSAGSGGCAGVAVRG